MLRYTEDDLDGAAVSSLIAAPEGERDEALRLLSEAAAPSSFETRFVRRNGDQFWAAVEVAPISGEDGKTHETLAVILDISERKRTEDEGRDLATLKSDFLALASHELRAPLTNINGGLEVMAPDVENLGGSTSRAFEIVSNEARRLTRLVESVLDISRLDAGQLPLVLGAVAVDPLLARAICGTEFAERTRTSIQPRLPLIWADEVYLEQVLRNVISNATKYASGMIDVQARLDGDRVLICVTDAGPGIAPEEQQQIFEPFFRGAQRTDRDGGYGLGLYFARRLVEAQGGSIMVQSPVGADPLRPGTRFCISMPLAPEVT
jgi:signal transduction histidine kinase